jgi:hypothetical protein
MKAHGFSRARGLKLLQCLGFWPTGLLLSLLVILLGANEGSAAGISFDPPISFFTNVASRLLRSDIGLDLTRIQIYPTNQYSPAAHRALQVAANLFDASTNRGDYPYPPSVFRPLFTNDNGTVYICGYEEVTNASLAGIGSPAPIMRDLSLSNDVVALQSHDMVYGIPVVVGVKKGWPNFNEFAMQTTITTTRRLQFLRDTNSPNNPPPVVRTNQMYLLGISNVFGVEGWNSYASNFSRPLQMIAVVNQAGVVSNESGAIVIGPNNLPVSNYFSVGAITNIAASTWQGFSGSIGPDASFQVPIFTNYWILPNCEYQFRSTSDPPDPTQGRFVPISGAFESNSISMFPLPHWWLALQTRVRFIFVDTSVTPNRIVDYVNLNSIEKPIDMNGTNMIGGACNAANGSDGSEWCTNRLSGGASVLVPTYGIQNQIQVCMGNITPQRWNNYIIESPVGSDIARAIQFFDFQFGMGASDGTFGFSNVFNAPFSPFRNIIYYTSWQANDPLVHYTIGDLINGSLTNRLDLDQPNSKSSTITNLGRMNLRYEPWGGGGNVANSSSKTKLDLSLKDPSAVNSDGWNFPTNQGFDLSSLGQVHRGTPWQTIFLKSRVADMVTWTTWASPTSPLLAQQTHPTNDWHLVSWLVPLLNTNDPRNLFSVNQPSVAGWCSALDGISVLTNISNNQLSPAIMVSNSPQATTIGTALDMVRSGQPGHFFQGIGDILATPALSVTSPWFNPAWTNAITEQAYESIPSQLLPRLRPDSVGSISRSANGAQIQFTGFDDWRYAVQVSSNFKDWSSVSTNSPVAGVFNVSSYAGTGGNLQFYRTLLLP